MATTRRAFWARWAAFTLIVACAPSVPCQAAVSVPSDFVDDRLAGGLDQPTSMAFTPDGRLLITEQRTARVRLFVNAHIAAHDPLPGIPDVNTTGYESGLLGIAVDPRWPAYPYVYLDYNRIGGKCRLVRYTAAGDINDSGGENLGLYGPLVLIDDLPDASTSHNCGALRFGPGGYLYMGLGDDENPCGAADSSSLVGALLRLDVHNLPPDSGLTVPRFAITPPDNPFSTSSPNARLVWAYGMRNPWRFDVDGPTGAVYLSDVGEADFEEIDEVLPGDYLGWPYREGYKVMTPAGCFEPGGSGSNFYKTPIAVMPHGAGATAIICAGMYRPVPSGSLNWPAQYYGIYGDLFYGEYFTGILHRLKRIAGQWFTTAAVPGQPDPQNWATGLIAEVDFRIGPDGSLWWLSQFDATFSGVTGSLHRIRHAQVQADVAGATDRNGALASAPNPFTVLTEITFRLAAPSSVRLEVIDVSGRRVRMLLHGEAPAGETRIAWDGKDDSGVSAAPGVYLARLERGGRVTSARILRVE